MDIAVLRGVCTEMSAVPEHVKACRLAATADIFLSNDSGSFRAAADSSHNLLRAERTDDLLDSSRREQERHDL